MLKKKKSIRLVKTLIEKRKARKLRKKAIIDDVKLGCSASESARRHDVCEGTLRQWQFYDKQFCAQLKSGRQQGIKHLKKCLLIELKSGKLLKDAVLEVGVTTSTIQNWRRRDAKFHSAVRSALGKK
jgi:transposase